MTIYLLDTSALSPIVDNQHPKHAAAKSTIANLGRVPIYVSVLALAELRYGLLLHEKTRGQKLVNAERILKEAESYPRQDVDRHTAAEYAELKSNLALHYLKKPIHQHKTKYVEDWIDQFTGKALGIDDNDLWICAQGRFLNWTVIADDKMNKIKMADSLVKILPINP